MSVLGAILAGGWSSRFGSDKALAQWRGRALLDHVVDAIVPHVDAIVVCGRDLPDRPAPDLGPLGGINAALAYAATQGFDRVVTAPCDTPVLSSRLLATLAAAREATVVTELPVIGSWPATLAPHLDAWLADGHDRSVRTWAAAVDAKPLVVAREDLPRNINRPADLADLG